MIDLCTCVMQGELVFGGSVEIRQCSHWSEATDGSYQDREEVEYPMYPYFYGSVLISLFRVTYSFEGATIIYCPTRDTTSTIATLMKSKSLYTSFF